MDASVHAESAARVSRCVTELLRKQPFFGSLALRMPLKPDPSRKTLAGDGREIRFNPRWAADTAAAGIETAIARVVLACALKHHTRRGGRDPGRWQHASQLVTHALLREAGFSLPADAEAWGETSVEGAYDRLPAEDGETPGDSRNPDAGGGSSGGGPSGDAGKKPDPSATQAPEDRPAPEDGGADNADPSAAPASHDPAGTGEVMDAPRDGGAGADPTPAEVAAEEQAWDEAMHQAASLAKAEGKLPGAIAETVRGAHAARLDWRALLRRVLAASAKSDYSWSAPNHRFIDRGLYLPSLRAEGMDTLAVIIDTSGSLPAETVADFWTELRGAAAEIQPGRVVVVQVDTRVRHTAEHTAHDLPEEIEIHGRGGTNFRPGFAWLEKQCITPAVCLYFTDMECSRYPETEPPFPVIWVNWGDPPEDHRREPWGERIDIG